MHEEPETWNIAYGHVLSYFLKIKTKIDIFSRKEVYPPLNCNETVSLLAAES